MGTGNSLRVGDVRRAACVRVAEAAALSPKIRSTLCRANRLARGAVRPLAMKGFTRTRGPFFFAFQGMRLLRSAPTTRGGV